MNQSDPYRFNKTGDAFSLHDPRLIGRADFDLWNDSFCVKADHTGRVEGNVYTPNGQAYADNIRPVYCVDRDCGEFRSLSWGPVFKDPDSFSFNIHLDHVSWRQEYKGIASKLSLAVPREGNLEAWRLTVENQGSSTRRLSIIPAIPTGLLGLLDQESVVEEAPFGMRQDYFPYYVQIPDYDKMARRWNTTFFYPDRAPDSWTALERDFLGVEGWTNPAAIRKESLGYQDCHYERGIFALRYEVDLEPGEAFSLGWIMGPARSPDHAREMRDRYPPESAFEKSLREQAAFRSSQQIPLRVSLPDVSYAHYINHWSPDRSIRIGRTLRFNPSPQARNAIQDTMTLSLFDPDAARKNFLAIWKHQDPDGFMPHGLPMVPDAEVMPITLIPHKDTNAWGPLALDLYLRETGDRSILDEPVPYKHGSKAALREHIERGLEWLLNDRTARGLSRIGQGDWNDPLNMAGPEGKGESVWLTQALAVSLQTWADLLGRLGESGTFWSEAAEECRNAVREHCWDGSWFLRAFSDDGTLIGSHKNAEGALFLNAQSWALMAGIPDAAQTKAIIESVNKHLGTSIAPAVLGPPYRGMRKHVGKLTLKTPGTGENGSIYAHAALFWSFALYKAGHADAAWPILRNLVPGTEANPVERAGQVPLYIPNFYRGPAFKDVFGMSSHSPNTGSAAWVYMTFIEEVIGLKGGCDHLLVQPKLPSDWNEISGERLFRGTRYVFTMRRAAGIKKMEVRLNGNVVSERIPWKSLEKSQSLEVSLP